MQFLLLIPLYYVLYILLYILCIIYIIITFLIKKYEKLRKVYYCEFNHD